jgi:RNA polymerase sigma-70 factor (ECF subfamily)
MDTDTLVRMLETHTPMLRALAHQLAQDSHEAEDLVQEAFLALAKLPKCPEFPKTWLWRTLRNQALSRRRGWFRRQNRERQSMRDPSIEEDPSARMSQAERMGKLGACLGELPAEERELLAAILWGEMSFAEAAQVLGGSSSSLHRRYHATLDRLRVLMGEKEHATAQFE